MISADSRWHERDHHLQTLYVPPVLQQLLPQFLIGDEELPENVVEVIREHDLPRLKVALSAYYRGAATRFFNLPSARRCLERSLATEREAIAEWIANETSARYSFDYFGEAGDSLAGYGIVADNDTKLLWTKSIRHVMQRGDDGKPILWTAYPLLSPRHACWMDHYDYASHQPATRADAAVLLLLKQLFVGGRRVPIRRRRAARVDRFLLERVARRLRRVAPDGESLQPPRNEFPGHRPFKIRAAIAVSRRVALAAIFGDAAGADPGTPAITGQSRANSRQRIAHRRPLSV